MQNYDVRNNNLKSLMDEKEMTIYTLSKFLNTKNEMLKNKT